MLIVAIHRRLKYNIAPRAHIATAMNVGTASSTACTVRVTGLFKGLLMAGVADENAKYAPQNELQQPGAVGVHSTVPAPAPAELWHAVAGVGVLGPATTSFNSHSPAANAHHPA